MIGAGGVAADAETADDAADYVIAHHAAEGREAQEQIRERKARGISHPFFFRAAVAQIHLLHLLVREPVGTQHDRAFEMLDGGAELYKTSERYDGTTQNPSWL